MITLEEFTKLFEGILEDSYDEGIKASTEFRKLDEWSSLTALSIIALADDEFDVAIKGMDIVNSNTVEDLYKVILSKKKN